MTVAPRPRTVVATRPRFTSTATLPLLVAAVLVVVLVIATARPVSAHVDLLESDPVNVSTVAAPVETIRLTFSAAADPVADEFVLEGGDGADVPITSVVNDGEDVLVVTPDSSPEPGRSRLTWAIRSGDSHTMTGTIAFTVTSAGTAVASADDTVTQTPTAADASSGTSSPARGLADLVAGAGRWLVYLALLFCVGGLAHLAWVHRGSTLEGRRLVFLVRRAALLVVIGSVVEWLAQTVIFSAGDVAALWSPSDWLDLAGTGFARGTVLRIVGAVVVLACLRMDLDASDPDGDTDPFAREPTRPAIGGVALAEDTRPVPSRVRVEASPLALVGAALLVLSEAFIGHTASTEPRLVVVAADAAHLAAAGVWATGATMVASTLARRRSRGEPLDARLLASRFSVVAAWVLAAGAVTGVVLAWTILGEPSALWSTEFGRLLLAKVALVGVVVAIGAHNHRVLVPALVAGDDSADERFRRAITAEAAAFGLVLLLTAGLVASSPT
jgi:copper transport protein